MKQLKKISLQKEELVSLNSPQMDAIKGGVSTSPVCSAILYYSMANPELTPPIAYTVYQAITYGYNAITGYFNGGDDDYPDAEYTSQYYVEGACMMPPVIVTP